MKGSSVLRIGVAGCGRAARIHLDRLLSLTEVAIIGCVVSDRSSAELLVARIGQSTGAKQVPVLVFTDHRELLRQLSPDALCIFTPHLWHYRLAMDALQAGCHVFIEKPLSTNVQEAADIVGLARGRSLKVAVGHQYRLCPSLAEARRHLEQGTVGPLRLVTAALALPWRATQGGSENSWRFDPKVAGEGVLADSGDHLIDALLWTTSQATQEVCAFQSKLESGLDLVTAATIRLMDGTPVSLAVSGLSPGFLFELNYFGERGRIRATDQVLELDDETGSLRHQVDLPAQPESIEGNFVAALCRGTTLCCPADQALDTVRLWKPLSDPPRPGNLSAWCRGESQGRGHQLLPPRSRDPHESRVDRDRENWTNGESFQGRTARMPTNPKSKSLAGFRERPPRACRSREKPLQQPAATGKSRYLTMMCRVD